MSNLCERWEGVKSLPRVRQLEAEGVKRKAIAKRFNVTTATIRNAEKKEGKEVPPNRRDDDPEMSTNEVAAGQHTSATVERNGQEETKE